MRLWKSVNQLGIKGGGEEDEYVDVIKVTEAGYAKGNKVQEVKVKKVQ